MVERLKLDVSNRLDVEALRRFLALHEGSCEGSFVRIGGVRALAKELGVEDKVCFAGWISGMDDFYQALDINTLTSLSETFPYALTEGARYALPTIASRVGGVPYLIDHAVNGYLFTAGNPEELGKYLLTLAEDAALRRTMGEKLRDKAAEKFSLAKTVETQLAIYEDVARRHAARKSGRNGVLICGS
jgi:glycosyltransferase involved in cell wall biosynthesis